jgi:hypothetical protein
MNTNTSFNKYWKKYKKIVDSKMSKSDLIARYLLQTIVDKSQQYNDIPKELRIFNDPCVHKQKLLGWYIFGELTNLHSRRTDMEPSSVQVGMAIDVPIDYATANNITTDNVIEFTKLRINDYLKNGITSFMSKEEQERFLKEIE